MSAGEQMGDLDAIRFYGKYRGLVLDNIDPQQIARIIVQVPDVLGLSPSSWAMPCVPMAGLQAGCFMVPAIGSQVWVEFEQGDPDYPIWVGGFWGTFAEVPGDNSGPPGVPKEQNIVLQTTGQNSMMLSDAPPTEESGGIVLKSLGGAMIVVNQSGIYLSNGQGATITLIGSAVAINNDGLLVI
jgi:Type VI secretion system/phage-baseplate injector OB domain